MCALRLSVAYFLCLLNYQVDSNLANHFPKTIELFLTNCHAGVSFDSLVPLWIASDLVLEVEALVYALYLFDKALGFDTFIDMVACGWYTRTGGWRGAICILKFINWPWLNTYWHSLLWLCTNKIISWNQ